MSTTSDPQPCIVDPPVAVGSAVHLYHEDCCFDFGRICEIQGDNVVVDFNDWKQCWPSAALIYDFRDGRLVLIPCGPGVLVEQYRD